jgi:hypothetical protein
MDLGVVLVVAILGIQGLFRGLLAQVLGFAGLVIAIAAGIAIRQWVGAHWQGAQPAVVFWVLRWLVILLCGVAVLSLFQVVGSGWGTSSGTPRSDGWIASAVSRSARRSASPWRACSSRERAGALAAMGPPWRGPFALRASARRGRGGLEPAGRLAAGRGRVASAVRDRRAQFRVAGLDDLNFRAAQRRATDPSPVDRHSLELLEFSRVASGVAAHAASPAGRMRVASAQPLTDASSRGAELVLLAEAIRRSGEPGQWTWVGREDLAELIEDADGGHRATRWVRAARRRDLARGRPVHR